METIIKTPGNLPTSADLDAHAEEQRLREASAPAPDSVLPPTLDEIDVAINDYASAQHMLRAAQEVAEEQKKRIVFLVDSFGHVPSHAEQSIRIFGRRNIATITRGNSTVVNEDAIDDFEEYLGSKSMLGIFPRFFCAVTKHTLVEGARDVLKTFILPRRTEEKVLSLFGRCIDIRTKSPSVKIELIQPEKPARTPRTGKQAA